MLPSGESLTLHVLTDAQLAAFEERIVERVAEIVVHHWLPREPLTLEATAEYFSVSISTIRRWTTEGALGCWKYGNTVLYLPDHIAAFIAAGRTDEQEVAA